MARRLNIDLDSLGTTPSSVRRIPGGGRPDLVENSAAVMSTTQPGIIFTINDSGHEPELFALDTTGRDRGKWLVEGADNVDWEAASSGPCRATGNSEEPGSVRNDFRCLYIGDVGDNGANHSFRVIYRLPEPRAAASGHVGAVAAERLAFRYPDRRHDVEAMYVWRDGTIYLITKRTLRNAGGSLRRALVFAIAPAAWRASDSIATATLVDSLDLVPGSAPGRTVTDASLSVDGAYLAVRTYLQVYVFAVDRATGRVRSTVTPSICSIIGLAERQGEGIAWYDSERLLLTSEGSRHAMHVVQCPLPHD